MGAEIQGVDVTRITDSQFEELEDALYRHKMIFLRNQKMSHADQETLTKRFGEFGIDAYTSGAAGHSNVQPVSKEADSKTKFIFGSGWHTDSPFLQTPPKISTLYGVDIPPYGGDTVFCNTVLAYQALSDTMKQMIDPLRVHMTARDVIRVVNDMKTAATEGNNIQGSAFKQVKVEEDENTISMIKGSMHPLVRTHPVTKEKALYVDETYSKGIEGLHDDEALPLLGFLVGHASRSAFGCRLRWEPGTFAMWDNRICIHQAFNDYDGFRREMYRTTVKGEIPF